jgi:hypothetical protein
MQKVKDIIKIIIGLEVIVLLVFAGGLMLQEMGLKDLAYKGWQAKIEQHK